MIPDAGPTLAIGACPPVAKDPGLAAINGQPCAVAALDSHGTGYLRRIETGWHNTSRWHLTNKT